MRSASEILKHMAWRAGRTPPKPPRMAMRQDSIITSDSNLRLVKPIALRRPSSLVRCSSDAGNKNGEEHRADDGHDDGGDVADLLGEAGGEGILRPVLPPSVSGEISVSLRADSRGLVRVGDWREFAPSARKSS